MNKILLTSVLVSLAMVSAIGTASANQPPSTVVPLYPEGTVKPLPRPELREDPMKNGQTLIRNVGVPTLEIFRPAPEKANGAAVIVAPGGGFVALVYDNEGTAVGKRLAEQGITAFVLKYRLVQTPENAAEMAAQHMKEMEVVMARAASGLPDELPLFQGEPLATQDGARAVGVVRARAAEWGVDPRRVGVVGFSAGAFLAADLAIGPKEGRPDFVGLIYGGLRAPVPMDAPPAFIATAADDEMLPNDPILLYNAWRAAGRPAELHVFERGGHGFGMTARGTTSDQWFDSFVAWMRSRGIIGASQVSQTP